MGLCVQAARAAVGGVRAALHVPGGPPPLHLDITHLGPGTRSHSISSLIASLKAGLGTAFFYALNALFFCVLLKHAMFFCVFFEFLATYETQKNDALFYVLFLRT